MTNDQQHTNRLSSETSPYLLQHAHNPVDWYPWGEEAFEKARTEDKPIFLSIGYSACHWCHVMERESFEDEGTAAILNRDFVSIKVDREERPEVDAIYMQAVQMMTGHGGWPMSMFLTTERVPFYGGTYFPPQDRHGMPSFARVLHHVATIWKERREQVTEASAEIREILNRSMTSSETEIDIDRDDLDAAAGAIASNFDRVNGGFGGAPKFPASMSLEFLLQVATRTEDATLLHVVTESLEKMARGGIYDHLGGGFARYSVDARWLVPHFEKMLYDNALLIRLYVRGWQATKSEEFAVIARESIEFILREMTSPEGGFYSTLDADSEGVEGKFYVWSLDEIREVLGDEDARAFAALYDGTERGNWEGTNILNLPRRLEDVARDLSMTPQDLQGIAGRARQKLLERRSGRVRPGRDEKILAGWNGWMLAAIAEAAIAFRLPRYSDAVKKNADFLIETFVSDGRLSRSFRDGRVRFDGVLEDYGGVAWGLIKAFEVTAERRYLDVARQLIATVSERFRDTENGAFFDVSDDHEELIARPKEIMDNATPSGNSLVIYSMLRLARYFAEPDLEQTAIDAIRSLWPVAMKYPSGFGFLLGAAEWLVTTPLELVVSGGSGDEKRERFLGVIGETYLPQHVLIADSSVDLPLTEGRREVEPALYICEMGACRMPVTDPLEAKSALGRR